VRNERVFEIGTARGIWAGQQSQFDPVRELPDVPVMSETLLLMELMVRGRSVDLSEVSELVLGDLGAALQVLRLAGRECAAGDDLPRRIEDCISGLGLHACLESMSRCTIKRSSRSPEMIDAWTHARAIAESCQALAEETSPSMSAEDAYLVGLFHAIGSLPFVLGWDRTIELTGNPEVLGLRMAQAWSLPSCVAEYFAPLRSISGPNRWREMVRQAHHRANCSMADDLLIEANMGNWARALSS